jgi:hypothetical protein
MPQLQQAINLAVHAILKSKYYIYKKYEGLGTLQMTPES